MFLEEESLQSPPLECHGTQHRVASPKYDPAHIIGYTVAAVSRHHLFPGQLFVS